MPFKLRDQKNPRNLRFPCGIWTPILYTHPSVDSTHHPKRHPDLSSRFPQFTHRTNHRQTDRWDMQQACSNTRFHSIAL